VTLPFDLDGQTWQVPAEVVGIGEPHHDHWRCPRCEATWVADQPEWCGWCCRNWVAMQRAQRTLDLMEPEWEHEVEAWTRRLVVAVETGRVTPHEAKTAVMRFLRDRPSGEAAR
jgi:hypothetical protein